MAEEHSSGNHPFFCHYCSVYLKCEAAYKSHNSKLHLVSILLSSFRPKSFG
jgi:hypothetical protein